MRKVLLSAFACEPVGGSEPYVGWQWASLLAEFNDLHVLTRRFNQSLIADHPLTGRVKFHYFDLPFGRRLKGTEKFTKAYYVIWQIAALMVGAYLNRRHGFAIIHHITYNVVDMPGFLWMLNSKFVWGPVGGGQVPPISLRRVYSPGNWKRQRIRTLLKKTLRFNPLVILAVRKAGWVLFANGETEARLSEITPRYSRLLETAIDVSPGVSRVFPINQSARVLWIGRFEDRKAPILALEAISMYLDLKAGPIHLEMIGDGPLIDDVAKKIKEMQLEAIVTIRGRLPLAAIRGELQKAQILLFTSVQDTSGNVVLEAMSVGTPVVALDHQGVREILTMGGGRLVPITSYTETVQNLALGLVDLSRASDVWETASASAITEASLRHSWPSRKEVIKRIYDEIAPHSE